MWKQTNSIVARIAVYTISIFNMSSPSPSSSSSSSSIISPFQSISSNSNNNNNNTTNQSTSNTTNDYSNTHIDYIMKYGNDKAANYNDLLRLQSDTNLLEYRHKIIIWLKKVANTYNLNSLIRDTSFQLFDTYLLNLSRNNNDDSSNTSSNDSMKQERMISLAAISCILVSSKLHNYHSVLALSNFHDFDHDELVEYQFEFLRIINFDIHVNSTPAVVIEVLLSLWNCDDELRSSLKSKSDIFVSEFHSLSVSMMFAPSTIAICAIILSFSTLRMDCSQWLNCVPDKCFRKLLADNDDSSFIDIDKCLDIFQRLEKVHQMLPKCSSLSPTSVVFASSPCASPTVPVTLASSSSCGSIDNRVLNEFNALPELGILDIDAIEEDDDHL